MPKRGAVKKIDAIVALSMALVAIVQRGTEINDIEIVALGETPAVTQEEQDSLDRERREQSARDIRRAIAERGVGGRESFNGTASRS